MAGYNREVTRSRWGLDDGVGEDDAARFRARRARGTRAPTGIDIWGNRGLGMLLVWPLYFGGMWIVATSPRTRFIGVIALGVGLIVGALYVRYLLKPIDPEFLPTERWWRRRKTTPLAGESAIDRGE